MRIAITGATGLVGSALVPRLQAAGHRVDRLVRKEPAPGSTDIRWDPANGRLDAEALEGVDVVIHLAGENVGEGRWTEERKKQLLESRTQGTTLLATTLAGLRRKPEVLISASAVGWYGDRGEQELDEQSGPGGGFLAEVCRAWEAGAKPAEQAGIRLVHPRIGVVLSTQGGALAQLLTPARMGVAGPVGSGRQYFPWLSMGDLLAALDFLMGSGHKGVYNVCGPKPVTNRELMQALGRVLHRPAILPLPAFAVRTLFGEMGQEILLGGQKVLPKRLLSEGFVFGDTDLDSFLKRELGR